MRSHLLYALVNKKTGDVCFQLGASAPDVWERVIEFEQMGTGHTVETLRRLGWRAKQVSVIPVHEERRGPGLLKKGAR